MLEPCMAINPTATAMARRDLVQRMERFLETVRQEARPLNAWETDLIRRVLANLETGYFRSGEDVMLQVERPDLYCSEKALETVAGGPTLTVAEVRASVVKVLQA